MFNCVVDGAIISIGDGGIINVHYLMEEKVWWYDCKYELGQKIYIYNCAIFGGIRVR